MRATYNLPRRFFFLPNQFWQHKNHSAIVAALAKLKDAGSLADVPPIVLTGLNKDVRNPGHFDDLMSRVRAHGVESHFRYLGLVPYDHVLALNATCERMINPSLFEGWSTPIEEAKALGTPLLLSDIAIHREQAPDAVFFDPASPDALANTLRSCSTQHLPPRPAVGELREAQDARLDDHARALLQTVTAAAAAKSVMQSYSKR